jgi:hypothetical protein
LPGPICGKNRLGQALEGKQKGKRKKRWLIKSKKEEQEPKAKAKSKSQKQSPISTLLSQLKKHEASLSGSQTRIWGPANWKTWCTRSLHRAASSPRPRKCQAGDLGPVVIGDRFFSSFCF